MKCLLALSLACLVAVAAGHGRLIEPPSRASAWRFGFNTPSNYRDNELFCGGFPNQQRNGGKCGVCGDPWQGPREHEAGGKYAKGIITREYTSGDEMDISVDITANHKGWFEFRLCPVNDPKVKATQECLNKNLLELADGSGSRYQITSDMRLVHLTFKLPEELECDQCVLQWMYHTGNSWGVDQDTNRACTGCGPQEQFYGCSDVTIFPREPKPIVTPPGWEPDWTIAPITTTTQEPTERPTDPTRPPPSTVTVPTQAPSTVTVPTQAPSTVKVPTKEPGTGCRATGAWEGNPNHDAWCVANCARFYCPPEHCICT